MEWPLLKPIEFALTVSATLDHRSARVPQVPIQPLLPQHGDECCEQGDKETRVHEASDDDDIARRTSLSGRNGGGLTGDGGVVESEEDGAEEGSGFLVRIGLEA